MFSELLNCIPGQSSKDIYRGEKQHTTMENLQNLASKNYSIKRNNTTHSEKKNQSKEKDPHMQHMIELVDRTLK